MNISTWLERCDEHHDPEVCMLGRACLTIQVPATAVRPS